MEGAATNVATTVSTTAATMMGTSFIDGVVRFMVEGGAFMWVILLVWAFGIAIIFERIAKL